MLEMLIKWVIFHTFVLIIVFQELVKVLMEPEKNVSWTTFLVFLLEVGVFLRVCSVVGLNQK